MAWSHTRALHQQMLSQFSSHQCCWSANRLWWASLWLPLSFWCCGVGNSWSKNCHLKMLPNTSTKPTWQTLKIWWRLLRMFFIATAPRYFSRMAGRGGLEIPEWEPSNWAAYQTLVFRRRYRMTSSKNLNCKDVPILIWCKFLNLSKFTNLAQHIFKPFVGCISDN